MTTLPSRSEGPSRSARVGAIVLALLGAACWLTILFVLGDKVPRFLERFKIENELPTVTKVVCATGLAVRQFWYAFGFGWLSVTAGAVLWVLRGRWKHRVLVVSLLGGISVLITPVILGTLFFYLFFFT